MMYNGEVMGWGVFCPQLCLMRGEMQMLKTVPAGKARNNFSELLSDAEQGEATMIIRNSTPVAALVPAELAEFLKLTKLIVHELGVSELMSKDADIVEMVKRADEEIALGDIVWYEE